MKSKLQIILFFGALASLVCAFAALAAPGVMPVVQPALFDAKSMLVNSGVAFDAHETVLGFIHVKEPKSFFKPDVGQVTWWGEFKPFKFWGKPQLEARWFAPPAPGEEKARQGFQGQVCVLAKSTLKLANPAQEGTWRVEIYQSGKQIDSKNFMIYGGGTPAVRMSVDAAQKS